MDRAPWWLHEAPLPAEIDLFVRIPVHRPDAVAAQPDARPATLRRQQSPKSPLEAS